MVVKIALILKKHYLSQKSNPHLHHSTHLHRLKIKNLTFCHFYQKITKPPLTLRYHSNLLSRSKVVNFDHLITPHPSLKITKKPLQSQKIGRISFYFHNFHLFITSSKRSFNQKYYHNHPFVVSI